MLYYVILPFFDETIYGDGHNPCREAIPISTNHHGHGILLLLLWLLNWTWSSMMNQVVASQRRTGAFVPDLVSGCFFWGTFYSKARLFFFHGLQSLSTLEIAFETKSTRKFVNVSEKPTPLLWVIWRLGAVFSGTSLRECRPQRKAQSVEEDSEFVRVPCGEEIPLNRSDCGRKYTAILRENHWCWDVEFILIFCDVLFMFSFLCSHFISLHGKK